MRLVVEMIRIDWNVVAERYGQGDSTHKLASRYGANASTIARHLRKMGVDLRGVGAPRKYNFDETFFDTIDTEPKAYILGLLFADGNNGRNTTSARYHVSIDLREDDVDILRKIRSLWANLPPLRLHRPTGNAKRNQYRLVICSKYLSLRLRELGCVERKSLVLRFPALLEPELVRHFVRGYFDGDGSLFVYRNRPKLDIVGTMSFCSTLRQIFADELKVTPSLYRKTRNDLWSVCSLVTSGKLSLIHI